MSNQQFIEDNKTTDYKLREGLKKFDTELSTAWEDKENCNCNEHACNNSAIKGRFEDLNSNILCGRCYYGYCQEG